jgi:hypothetical protein
MGMWGRCAEISFGAKRLIDLLQAHVLWVNTS